MTDKTNVTYVAQISLTLPGRPETATAIVTLAPADKIPLGDHAKPLAACTLAELRAYAAELEAEVWEAYEAISLLDLRADDQVVVHVAALDDKGQAVGEIENWPNQAIVLAGADRESLESAVIKEVAKTTTPGRLTARASGRAETRAGQAGATPGPCARTVGQSNPCHPCQAGTANDHRQPGPRARGRRSVASGGIQRRGRGRSSR